METRFDDTISGEWKLHDFEHLMLQQTHFHILAHVSCHVTQSSVRVI